MSLTGVRLCVSTHFLLPNFFVGFLFQLGVMGRMLLNEGAVNLFRDCACVRLIDFYPFSELVMISSVGSFSAFDFNSDLDFG